MKNTSTKCYKLPREKINIKQGLKALDTRIDLKVVSSMGTPIKWFDRFSSGDFG